MTRVMRILALLLALALLAPAALGEAAEVPVEAAAEAVPSLEDVDCDGVVVSGEEPVPEEIVPPEEEADAREGEEEDDGEAWVDETLPSVIRSLRHPGDGQARLDRYAAGILGLDGELAEANRHVGYELEGANLRLYLKLAGEVQAVAAGERSGTLFTVTPEELGHGGKLTLKQLGVSKVRIALENPYAMLDAMGVDFELVLKALLVDYPCDCYWLGDTFMTDFGLVSYTSKAIRVHQINFGFYPDVDFAVDGDPELFQVDAGPVIAAQTAVANALKVVEKNARLNDEGKLRAYAQYICDSVEYDNAAYGQLVAGDPDMGGSPWQIVNVFDGDPSTNVVCEGYAKAMKYLCDLTDFRGNVFCYLVTGFVGGDYETGHMWNIVTMPDRRNYHVDVTWTDSSYGESFILLPATEILDGGGFFGFVGGYVVRTAAEAEYIYEYDGDTLTVYGSDVLEISKDDGFQDDLEHSDKIERLFFWDEAPVRLAVGDSFWPSVDWEPLDGDPVTFFWSSSDARVATVSEEGKVTAKKAGGATITARSYSDLAATLEVEVADKVALQGIALPEGTQALDYNTSHFFTPTLIPWNGRSKLSWSSSDPTVVKADRTTGELIPVRRGTATIAVQSANGKRATMQVEVTDEHCPDAFEVYIPGEDGDRIIEDGDVVDVRAGETLWLCVRATKGGEPVRERRIVWTSSKSAVGFMGEDTDNTWFETQGVGSTEITAHIADGMERRFTVNVSRNRRVLRGAPTKAEIRALGKWGVVLKSLEIVSTSRAVAELYITNGGKRTSKYIRKLRLGIQLRGGEEPWGEGEPVYDTYDFAYYYSKKFRVKCRPGRSKLVRLTLPIAESTASLDLTSDQYEIVCEVGDGGRMY